MRKVMVLGGLAVFVALAAAAGLFAQDADPSANCDYRKAGLDPIKFHLYLTKDTPYAAWPLWPGTTAKMTASAPHGPYRSTYVNPAALRSITEGNGMSFGSLIVMEDLGADGTSAGFSAMLKIKGYNPGEGDWHWFRYDAKGAVIACGRPDACIACHRSQRGNDHLMTAPVR